MKEMTDALYANDLLEHCFFLIRLMCIVLVSSSVKCASENNQTRRTVRDKYSRSETSAVEPLWGDVYSKNLGKGQIWTWLLMNWRDPVEEDGRRLEGVAGTLRYPMVVSKPPRDLYLTENSSFQSGYNAKLTLIRVLKECHGKFDCLVYEMLSI